MKALGRIAAITLIATILVACDASASRATATEETVAVTKGSLRVLVSSSGAVEPEQAADLTFGVTGTVEKVFVSEGQPVKRGDQLASLDARDLDQQVLQAEANLDTAEARLEQARSGNATPEEQEVAQAGLIAAEAEYERAQTGNLTPADIADAEARVRNAEAGLTQAQTGNVTTADIEAAAADVRIAEAGLVRAQTGNITQADLDAAAADVRIAEAGLVRAQTGNITQADLDAAAADVRIAEAALTRAQTNNITEADLLNAEAALRQAEANLLDVQSGPSPDVVSAAENALTQAQQNYEKVLSAASANKTTAEQAMIQAADAVRLAQETYSSAYWDDEQAQDGIDPRSGRKFSDVGLDKDAQQRLYEEALRTAELQLRQAESQLEQAEIAYENAQQQEINDVLVAQAAVDDAQTQLDEILKGPKETDVLQAQAQVDQARAQLLKLQQGGTPADISTAQAQLDQARARLAKLEEGGTPADISTAQAQLDQARARLAQLQQGGTPADISTAQAQLDQARARLAKLTGGGTPADIAGAQALLDQANAQLAKLQQGGTEADLAAAQAQVDQAEAQLEQLTASAAASDIRIAEASVRQAEAQVAAAKLNREKASLRAPFDGVITVVNIAPGDTVAIGGLEPPFTLVDESYLHIDVSVGEIDIAQVREGQPAEVSIDALSRDPIDGTVQYIAPAATVEQNVTTYRVKIVLPQNIPMVRVGMSAVVDIGVAEKENVLIIPTSAIRQEGSKEFVRLKRGETFVDTEIRAGLSTDVETEVISGLNEGDVINVLGTPPVEPE